MNSEDMLHIPGWKAGLLPADEHMELTMRLSRALWLALDNPDVNTGDELDRLALKALASQVAHHASAAVAVMDIREEGEANAPA